MNAPGVGCISDDDGVGATGQGLGQRLGQAAVVVVWQGGGGEWMEVT